MKSYSKAKRLTRRPGRRRLLPDHRKDHPGDANPEPAGFGGSPHLYVYLPTAGHGILQRLPVLNGLSDNPAAWTASPPRPTTHWQPGHRGQSLRGQVPHRQSRFIAR